MSSAVLLPAPMMLVGEPKAALPVPGAGYTEGADAHPREYEQRIVASFDRALLAP